MCCTVRFVCVVRLGLSAFETLEYCGETDTGDRKMSGGIRVKEWCCGQ